MSAAAGLGLLTLIAQVEIAGHTRVLILDDCPAGLDGFYAPARNRIGLCHNNHSSDAPPAALPPAFLQQHCQSRLKRYEDQYLILKPTLLTPQEALRSTVQTQHWGFQPW